MHDLREGSQGSTEPEAGWLDLFSSRYWKVVSVGASLFLFQQLAGINAVVYYSTSVFRSAGITSDVAASALVGASNVFGTTVASSLMDKQGRKTSFDDELLWNGCLDAALIVVPLHGKSLHHILPHLLLSAQSYMCYRFSLGAGPVPALLLSEILPLQN